VRAPGMRSRNAPTARALPPPTACTPLTSRVAMPAILETTVSAMVVLPIELTNAESARSARCLLAESAPADEVLEVVEGWLLVMEKHVHFSKSAVAVNT